MIAKNNWFTRRKYTGWGLTPKTWQGVAYIIVIAGIISFVQSLHIDATFKLILTSAWTVFVLADILHVMASLKLDEREQKIEAIAERNASWTMVASIALSLLYVTTLGKDLRGIELMPVLIFPVITGVIVKAISNLILERKGI